MEIVAFVTYTCSPEYVLAALTIDLENIDHTPLVPELQKSSFLMQNSSFLMHNPWF